MNEVVVLTPERILEVTEDVLRRFGLAKATVVDVARALDVSHGSVYRHFPSKASLREAVAKRWLDRANAPLQKIAEASGPAPARLERWLRTMFAIKHKKVCDDPEMFATYLALAQEACEVVKAHKERLVEQIAHILSDGVKQGAFAGHRRQGRGARDFRCDQPLPSSGACRGMERSGAACADRRACWRCCSGAWKRRVSADHSHRFVSHPAHAIEPPPFASLRAATRLLFDIDQVSA